MQRGTKILALILATSMFITACGSKQASESPAVSAEVSAIVSAPETASAEPEVTEETAQQSASTTTDGREITDMADRKVIIPNEIQTVYSANPISAIYLYTLVPDKLLGWNYELNDIERSIILEKYHSLPNFGMADAVNYEAVIAANPSIAFSVSKINDASIDEADKLSEKLGVPVVVVSSELNDAPAVYRFMGDLFNTKDSAEKLAAYAEKTFKDIADANIPEDKKVRVYYGNGENSLETAPAGSAHAQILDMINAINVADLEAGDGSRIQISAEQLLAWDPEVIVVNGEPKSDLSGNVAAEALLNNPDFAQIKAVKDKKVYGAPNAPFSWVDRPPGPNRIIGMRWLSKLVYPEYFDYDLDAEVREFFNLFYHVDLTDEQLQQLYNGLNESSTPAGTEDAA